MNITALLAQAAAARAEAAAAAGAATLPKGLRESMSELQPAERRQLSKLTADGRLRIIHCLRDSAQPLPHCAVVLQGRKIAGWVVKTGYENESAFDAAVEGEKSPVSVEYMEAFLPNLAYPPVASTFKASESGTYLRLLRVERGVVDLDSEGRPRETRRSAWQRGLSGDLTFHFGMVEVMELGHPHAFSPWQIFSKGVLVPMEKTWDWECVSTEAARMRATFELRTPAFWTLGVNRCDRRADSDSPLLEMQSIANTMLLKGEADAYWLSGLVEIDSRFTHPTAGPLILNAKRNYNDNRWRMTLNVNNSPRPLSQSYPIVSGAAAVQLAEIALLRGELPAPATGLDNEDLSLQEFQRLAHDVHDRRRTLKHICEAFNITEPPADGKA